MKRPKQSSRATLLLAFIIFCVVLGLLSYSDINTIKTDAVSDEIFTENRLQNVLKRRLIHTDQKVTDQSENTDVTTTTGSSNTFTPLDHTYYRKYLKYNKLEESCKTLVDLSKSTAEIINTARSSYFNVGDAILVEITLYDIFGEVVKYGGDFIKIWMRESEKDAGSTGYVIDHHNGNYTGVLHALWRGSPIIKIMLSFPKETIGLFVDNIYKNGILFKLDGVFKNNNGESKIGVCGIHQRTEKRSCNFTSRNYGMRWFCSLPEEEGFVCDNWYGPKATMETTFSDRELSFLRSNSNRLFREIKIIVKGDKVKDLTNIPCRKLSPSKTWQHISPVGFFHQNKWHSLSCKDNFPATNEMYKRCLQNREIYMIGDSSLRMWFIAMTKMLNLNITIGPKYILHGSAWHQLAKAESEAYKEENITVIWTPHEMPFFSSAEDAIVDHFKPASFYLEKITSEKPIIILHWYLHLAATRASVFQEHTRKAKSAIIKFLKRVPDAKIFIKGPHNINIKRNKGIPHDFVRFYQEDILFREFEEISDKIMFLNEWDITVASESKETHPSQYINRQMVHNMMTLIC